MTVRPSMLRLVVCSTALFFAVGCGNPQVISLLRVERTVGILSDHKVYTETQATLLKSSFVVAAALRNPEISELEVVKSHDDPVAWLESSLKVHVAAGSELLRVSMAVADDADQTSKIVDAVVDAYLAEIVRKEQAEKLVMLDKLRRRAETVREQVRSKTDEFQDPDRPLGTAGHATGLPNPQVRITLLSEKQLELELRLIELNHALAADVGNQKRVVAEQIDYVRKEQDKELAKLESRRALTVRADELDLLRGELSAIQQDMFKLEQDLAGPERIAVIQRATVVQ